MTYAIRSNILNIDECFGMENNMVEKNNKTAASSGSAYKGIKGRALAALMNFVHKPIHKLFAKNLKIEPKHLILDIGCGGGALIKEMLKHNPLKVYGIDYSKTMICISIKKNNQAVQNKKAEITFSSVSQMPYTKNKFDIITAFETIHYWPNLANDFKEVKRVLKESGTFFIMNRFPDETSKWYDFVQLKTTAEYKRILEKAGFEKIHTDADIKKGWILVKASL